MIFTPPFFVYVVRMAVPLVTRSILEVVIPEYAVTKLIAKSKSKLAQISEVCEIRSLSLLQYYLNRKVPKQAFLYQVAVT